MKYLLSIIIIGAFIVSCVNSQEAETKSITFTKKEAIVSDTSDGWGGDLTLSITKITKEASGKETMIVISSYKGSDIGFEMELTPIKNTSKGFHETGILIRSSGKMSDQLLKSLSTIYNIKSDSTLKFIDSFSTAYVNLDEFAESLGDKEKTETVNTKLFFNDSKNEGDYGELFFNFNRKEGWVELKEKDSEYRPAVINAFRKK